MEGGDASIIAQRFSVACGQFYQTGCFSRRELLSVDGLFYIIYKVVLQLRLTPRFSAIHVLRDSARTTFEVDHSALQALAREQKYRSRPNYAPLRQTYGENGDTPVQMLKTLFSKLTGAGPDYRDGFAAQRITKAGGDLRQGDLVLISNQTTPDLNVYQAQFPYPQEPSCEQLLNFVSQRQADGAAMEILSRWTPNTEKSGPNSVVSTRISSK